MFCFMFLLLLTMTKTKLQIKQHFLLVRAGHWFAIHRNYKTVRKKVRNLGSIDKAGMILYTVSLKSQNEAKS